MIRHQPARPLPPACSIAFKEWAGVCRAIGSGRQSLILRKGGIAEGPGGFAPEHDRFWLYPTGVHEAQQGLREDPGEAEAAGPDSVPIDVLAEVAAVVRVERAEALDALEPYHVWTAETVRKRFAYRRPGLWALVVRARRRAEPARLEVTAEQAGCRTWVDLPRALATGGLRPALDDEEFARRASAIAAALAEAEGGPWR
jgi:hypothetical protein